jgi:hypothetical protein
MSDLAIDEILDRLAKAMRVDRAEVRCEVYKGWTQLYARFSGTVIQLSNDELKPLLALADEIDATLYVGPLSEPEYDEEHAQWKKGVEVTLGVGPVKVERIPRTPLNPDP